MSHHPMGSYQHDGKYDVEREPVPFVRCDRCDGWPTEAATETEHGRVCDACALLCDDCDKPHVAIHSGLRMCGDCETAALEDQAEREYAAFHGGSAPYNDAEREAVKR